MDMAKKLKNDNLLTEDGQKDHETEVQKLTDKYVKVIDEHVAAKEREVMKV
jgi:ribosome recycling factor